MALKVTVLLLAIMAFWVVVGVIGEILWHRYDRKQKAPYQAIDRFVVYHMGGLPGVRKKAKIQLLINRDRLVIKARRRPAVTMSTRDIRKIDWLGFAFGNGVFAGELPEEETLPENLKFLSKVGSRTEWTLFGRIQRYIVLHYEQGGIPYAVAFGFRFGEMEVVENEPVYQCLDTLEWYKEHSWKRNPEDAAGTVNLRKKPKPKNGRAVWRQDPGSGMVTAEWEELR
ncbi:hypothetical protein [Saccharibacillus alkalitolerans]|uniref:Uncharacterized protein n=1 Tax=Saccharibacillus alkalitolerans TaxID=2705290 RepID=A0ABX0F7R2_9BACL|nr:hypothetical protein [Saccharibacillus alkalitolerans]NGZ76475.1 hypothetical protein [Saccharibacillus alkalitolerans]